ncbi:MAG TPA: CDP-alcohol phosphatidyltransferase family protein [Gemmatimonadaceae bacterium]|nr:CDP-alcohol phosphatidyltransferase family protein [Gemmatimonadaceae bacterium]
MVSALRALPNAISFSRVVLAVAFVLVHGTDARLTLVAVAAATDFLDGFIARRARVTSRWGALIDPFADRVFALVAVSTFLFEGELSTIGYFVMISRDLMTAVGFLVARVVRWLKPVQFRARFSGKVVTALQMIAFIALLRFPGWITACLWLVGLSSLYSIVDYTYALWRERAQ